MCTLAMARSVEFACAQYAKVLGRKDAVQPPVASSVQAVSLLV
jgi:hypothetical protein